MTQYYGNRLNGEQYSHNEYAYLYKFENGVYYFLSCGDGSGDMGFWQGDENSEWDWRERTAPEEDYETFHLLDTSRVYAFKNAEDNKEWLNIYNTNSKLGKLIL